MSIPAPLRADASDLAAFRDSARALCERLQRPGPGAGRGSGLDTHAWREIAAAGWLAIAVPESRGGMGLPLRYLHEVCFEAGRAALDPPFVAAGLLGAQVLAGLPRTPAVDALLARVLDGSVRAGVAWQERDGDLDARLTATTMIAEAGRFVLDGEKRWTPAPGVVDGWLVVGADATGRPGIGWLPASMAGSPSVGAQPIATIDGSAFCTLRFARAAIDPSQPLATGEIVRTALDEALAIARLAQSADLLGGAQQAFDLTLDYLKTRVQFGRTIGANQALQHRMVDAYARLEMAKAGALDAIDRSDAGEIPRAEAASRVKTRAAEVAQVVVRLAVQFHGAIGITAEYPLSRTWRRAHLHAAWLGNADRHRARWLSLDRARGALVRRETHDDPGVATDDWQTADVDRFRTIVRRFLREHYPEALRNPGRRLRYAEVRDWYRTLSGRGWLAPAWPREHGGMGLSPEKLLAYVDEFESHGVARLPDQGVINIGPILIRHGTDDQRARYLPRILSGEHIWCQGYSEPDAGSDLASLRTRATPVADGFRVTGQKIWSTLAHDATHMFALVRTSDTGRKHDGISFLLVDLREPGVTVRPIANLVGDEEFCEVFLDDVHVPARDLVGTRDGGWKIAMALMGHERLFVGSPRNGQYALDRLRRLAESRGLIDDPAFLARFATLALDQLELRAAYARYADLVRRGLDLPPSVSLLKLWATDTYTRISAALVDASDESGACLDRREHDAAGTVAPLAQLVNASATTLYGGTNEIQRNILAKQVLGLDTSSK